MPAALAQSSGKIRFGVGPLQPTPAETKKAYEPFFAYLAKQIEPRLRSWSPPPTGPASPSALRQ
jgi:hypothetical protein